MKYILELLVVAFDVFLGIYVGEQKSQRKTDMKCDKYLKPSVSRI